MTKARFSKLCILLIYILLGLWLLFLNCDFGGKYIAEYIILISSYFVIGGLFIVLVFRKNADVFEPIYLTLILLIGLFSVAPICITSSGVDSLYGKNFMSGCIKTTCIYMMSCFFLCFGYYKKNYKREKSEDHLECKLHNPQTLLNVMYGIWLFGFLIGMWYELHSLGRNPLYILTLGGAGVNDSSTSNISSVNFLLNFSYSCIFPWIYILFLEKRLYLKIITTYCMLMLYIVCGWRNVIIIVALAAVTVFYMNKNKRPSFKVVVICIVGGVVFLGVLGAVRHGLRNGYRTEVSVFDMDNIVFALESNFNLYQPFYAIVNTYPKDYMYTFGEGMIFDTLITFFPRFLWKSKPLARDFALLKAIRRSTSDIVIDTAAMAVPSIAEFYVDFGIIGCMVLSFVAGIVLQECTKLYKKSNRTFSDLALYGIIFGVLDQLVMRGYMPNNFYYIVFLIWPYFLADYIEKSGI